MELNCVQGIGGEIQGRERVGAGEKEGKIGEGVRKEEE